MLIALLTDFGTADYFVGAMKGAILSVNPGAQIVDITHEIPAHDVEAGAFTLLAAYENFPPATVHVAVVDPGVGSQRRPLLVSSARGSFVGPDNGIFSYILDREPDARVLHLTAENYFRPQVSATFHGRDIFAPVAAALTLGVAPDELGAQTASVVRLAPLRPQQDENGATRARIINVDRFGNLITNITPDDLTEESLARGARLVVGGAGGKREEISSFRRFFAAGQDEEIFAIWGSAGFLEIAAFRDSAARRLNAQRGDTITITQNRRQKSEVRSQKQNCFSS